MQFPVPQFTEVEDKIIGGLSLKQFGILFISGMIVVLAYTSTKNILIAGVVFLLIGVPGIMGAFAPFNGRRMYNCLPYIIKFVFASKVFVFRKEGMDATVETQVESVKLEKVQKPVEGEDSATSRLKKLSYLLEQKEKEEAALLKKQ